MERLLKFACALLSAFGNGEWEWQQTPIVFAGVHDSRF
jgi:hypothetical protein